MRRTLLLVGILLPWLAGVASGQAPPGPPDQQPPPKTPVVVEPGRGPQIPFTESRWEFWFYFNREPLLALQPALEAVAEGRADVDQPYVPLTEEDRSAELVPALVQSLRDKNPDVRIAAQYALAKTRDPAVRPYLIGQLHDVEYPVRLNAIVALGVWGNTVALSHLEDILADGDRQLQDRMYAALAIGLIGGPKASESLRGHLAPATFAAFPPIVKEGIAYAMGIAGEPDGAAAVRALLGDAAVTGYVVRSNLALSLGRIGDADSDTATLLALLRDPETQVRRSAAIALGMLHRGSGRDDVVKALADAARRDADLMVRNFAYLSLGRVGGKDTAALLLQDLEQMTLAHRPFIALALGLLGDPASVQPLQRQLAAEGDLSYRAALCIALGLHRDARAAPDLRAAYDKIADPVFRGYAALGLGMLRDVESIPRLTQVFTKEVDIELLPHCAIALGLVGDRSAASLVAARVPKERNEFVLQSLLYSLGQIGDRGSMPVLVNQVGESAPAYVREYAAIALGLLGDGGDVRAIARLSRDSNYTITKNFMNELFTIP